MDGIIYTEMRRFYIILEGEGRFVVFIKEAIIQNATGFHIRPAQLFSEKANEFKSDIKVRNEEGMEVDGKSILGLMTMGCTFGSKITIIADGVDEENAVNALVDLVNSKFGEEN